MFFNSAPEVIFQIYHCVSFHDGERMHFITQVCLLWGLLLSIYSVRDTQHLKGLVDHLVGGPRSCRVILFFFFNCLEKYTSQQSAFPDLFSLVLINPSYHLHSSCINLSDLLAVMYICNVIWAMSCKWKSYTRWTVGDKWKNVQWKCAEAFSIVWNWQINKWRKKKKKEAFEIFVFKSFVLNFTIL